MKSAFHIFILILYAALGGNGVLACSNDFKVHHVVAKTEHHPAFIDTLQQPPGDQKPTPQVIASELEGTVEVAFKIDTQGRVNILNINASNPMLIDYVVKKLSKIQLDQGSSQSGKVIKYRFVFKKQA